ncbi:hypothetical protein [Inquilinus sp.]|uniref:hypothetical protein n=1 Tax=Inquilinus sp. TaxID=1932117 RepID=UPI0037833862
MSIALALSVAGCSGAPSTGPAVQSAPAAATAARSESPTIRILVTRRNPDGTLSPDDVFASTTVGADWRLACAVRQAMIRGERFPAGMRRLSDGGELFTILAVPRDLPVATSMAGCKRAQLGRID